MTTSNVSIERPDFQLPNRLAVYWCVSEICLAMVFFALMVWNAGLQGYVDPELRQTTGQSLAFLLIIVMVWAVREMIPVYSLMVRQIYDEIFIEPKRQELRYAEIERKAHEESLARVKVQLERKRRKQLKEVGKSVNLREWVGERYIRRGGYIYILKDTEISGYYKIGKTTQPHERMKAFGVLLPFAVELIHVIQCDNANRVEAHLHQHYASKRQRGEWFNLTDEDIAELKLIHEWKVL